MKLILRSLLALPAAAPLLLAPKLALAVPCADLDLPNPVYGGGGSAVTPTLANVAIALRSLPGDEEVTIVYADPGACTGYEYFRKPDPLIEVTFKYWEADGTQKSCEAPQSVVEFAHMGNTPALCPGDVPIPDGAAKFVAPVQTINVITHKDSQEKTINAEALYHIFGFGPGFAGRTVAPWTEPGAIWVRNTSSFVHQILAQSIGVPAAGFKLPQGNFLRDNQGVVKGVFDWGEDPGNLPDQSLGYVSGSNAKKGEDDGQIKTLAYQHFDQTCAFLPDSREGFYDRKNVRSGQYWLWTPAWFFANVDEDGRPSNPLVRDLIGWFDGSIDPPGDLNIQELVVESGDVPLCAMQAIRPEGDLSAIQSYAPARPCNGWYEYISAGETDYQACETSDECDGEGEVCRLGFCEAY